MNGILALYFYGVLCTLLLLVSTIKNFSFLPLQSTILYSRSGTSWVPFITGSHPSGLTNGNSVVRTIYSTCQLSNVGMGMRYDIIIILPKKMLKKLHVTVKSISTVPNLSVFQFILRHIYPVLPQDGMEIILTTT